MFVWFWVFIRTNVLTCGTPCGKLFPMECHFLLQGLTLGELSNTQAGEQGSFDELFCGYGGITTLGLGSKLPADWSKRIYRPYDLDATSCVSLKSFPSEKIQRCIWIAQTYPSIRPPNDLTDCYWHLWFPICWTLPAILPPKLHICSYHRFSAPHIFHNPWFPLGKTTPFRWLLLRWCQIWSSCTGWIRRRTWTWRSCSFHILKPGRNRGPRGGRWGLFNGKNSGADDPSTGSCDPAASRSQAIIFKIFPNRASTFLRDHPTFSGSPKPFSKLSFNFSCFLQNIKWITWMLRYSPYPQYQIPPKPFPDLVSDVLDLFILGSHFLGVQVL